MDSLTQIVLGAACGEIVLGKKIGNKALFFGAIGGTIPDLDVIIGSLFFKNSIDKLAFHRGIMHSVFFAVLISLLLGFVIYKYYYAKKPNNITTQKDWTKLFFVSIFTHPILDSFTPYGTQLFRPFSDYRVAFNTISVVDPLYTIPFLVSIIIAMTYKRNNKKRLHWTKAGIIISSLYMLLTLVHKYVVNNVFEKSFNETGITYNRFRTQPTLFNNILWFGIAENDTNYMAAYYSLFNKNGKIDSIITIPKNHDLINMNASDLQTLVWFSDGYYNLKKEDTSNAVIYTDMRYPIAINNNNNSFVFNFKLLSEGKRWNTASIKSTKPTKKELQDFFRLLKGN